MKIHVFEDSNAENFLPLVYTRAVFDLRVGVKTLRKRILTELYCDDLNLLVRSYLKDYSKWRVEQEPYKLKTTVNDVSVAENNLFVNGRLLLDETTLYTLRKVFPKDNIVVIADGDLVLAKVGRDLAEKLVTEVHKENIISEIKDKAREVIDTTGKVTLLKWPWDIIKINAEMITEDYEKFFKGGAWEADYVDDKVTVRGDPRKLYLAKGVEIEPFVYIDVRKGPVYIGENTRVQAGARIEGPTYIGKDTIIVGGAQIREGSNVGDVCRVGGELEESVIHGYTNKYHFGFIGHAYVGEWVNLGAGTTNSDLKDTYGNVRVNIRGKRVDTGSKKVGSFIGDMTKTSIGVYIYTGKLIGVSAHLHGIVWENVPSFTIYAKSLGAEASELFLDSAIEIQRRMVARRGKTLSPVEEDLIRKVFELTAEEREEAGVKKGRFKLG